MFLTRKYIKENGENTMNSLTIGISKELQLIVTDTEEGLQYGEIMLAVIDVPYPERSIEIEQKEMRGAANAFTLLADMLDAEAKNND